MAGTPGLGLGVFIFVSVIVCEGTEFVGRVDELQGHKGGDFLHETEEGGSSRGVEGDDDLAWVGAERSHAGLGVGESERSIGYGSVIWIVCSWEEMMVRLCLGGV